MNDDELAAGLDALVPRLRQFVAVAHEEHLTRAADLLGVPQPTPSRSIARLEAELGVPAAVQLSIASASIRHDQAPQALAESRQPVGPRGDDRTQLGRVRLAWQTSSCWQG
jgi:DNA-binding transcriptional LysR family regulator